MLIDNRRPNTMVSEGLLSSRRYLLTNGRNRSGAGVRNCPFPTATVLLPHGGSGYLLEREKYEAKAGRLIRGLAAAATTLKLINAHERNNKS